MFPQTPDHTLPLVPLLFLSASLCSRLERRIGGTKAQIEQFTGSSVERRKWAGAVTMLIRKVYKRESAWPGHSLVPSGSGPAFPPLWPEGNHLRWNGITLRCWTCPQSQLLQKITPALAGTRTHIQRSEAYILSRKPVIIP